MYHQPYFRVLRLKSDEVKLNHMDSLSIRTNSSNIQLTAVVDLYETAVTTPDLKGQTFFFLSFPFASSFALAWAFISAFCLLSDFSCTFACAFLSSLAFFFTSFCTLACISFPSLSFLFASGALNLTWSDVGSK